MRGVTWERKNECTNRGNTAINEFIEFIENKHGGKCHLSSKHADMIEHVDFDYVTPKGRVIRIDFKAIKFITRLADDDADPDAYNVLELTAVDGSHGWVYGKANYICFETLESWLWVPRTTLVDFISKNVSGEPPVIGTMCTTEYHLRRYQRIQRKDVITIVTKRELTKLSTKIDLKPEHYVNKKI
jgi:hypothetical protein